MVKIKIFVVLTLFFPLFLFAETESVNLIKNGDFEKLNNIGQPLNWHIVRSLPTEEEILIIKEKNSVHQGICSLKIERFNDKAPFRSVAQNLNVLCKKGDVIEFGGWIKCERFMGGSSSFYISVYDGEKKYNVPSTPFVSKNKWVLSKGRYKFRFGGRFRYLTIVFQTVKSANRDPVVKKNRARGIFLYDNIYVKIIENKGN